MRYFRKGAGRCSRPGRPPLCAVCGSDLNSIISPVFQARLESRLAVAYRLRTNTSQAPDLPLSWRMGPAGGCGNTRDKDPWQIDGFTASNRNLERKISAGLLASGQGSADSPPRIDHLTPGLGFHAVAKTSTLAFSGGGSNSDFHRSLSLLLLARLSFLSVVRLS